MAVRLTRVGIAMMLVACGAEPSAPPRTSETPKPAHSDDAHCVKPERCPLGCPEGKTCVKERRCDSRGQPVPDSICFYVLH